MMVDLADTISIAEAARRAERTPNGIRYWAQRGAIETVPTPLGRVVVRKSLEAFISGRAEVSLNESSQQGRPE